MRRCGYLWTAALAGCILCGGGAAFSADPVEMIDNGGFEDGVSGWTLDTMHMLGKAGTVPHNGTVPVFPRH